MYCPFHSYLHSAALYVNRRILASNSWKFHYDGINPPQNVFEDISHSYDQWNKLKQSQQNRQSNETIMEPYSNPEESPIEFQVTTNPVKDVGYYSSNNGSGSTISNKMPYFFVSDRKSSITDGPELNVDLLCQPSSSARMYKLNFFSFDGQIKELSDSEPLVENVAKCDSSGLSSVDPPQDYVRLYSYFC